MSKLKVAILFYSLICLIFAQITKNDENLEMTERTSSKKSTASISTAQSFQLNCTLEFATFKIKFDKKYLSSSDETYHKSIFCKTLKEIYDHNANNSSPFKMAINFDSDIDQSQNPRSNGIKFDEKTVKSAIMNKKVKQIPPIKVQTKVRGNYKHIGNLTGPVKDQGKCGACW